MSGSSTPNSGSFRAGGNGDQAPNSGSVRAEGNGDPTNSPSGSASDSVLTGNSSAEAGKEIHEVTEGPVSADLDS